LDDRIHLRDLPLAVFAAGLNAERVGYGETNSIKKPPREHLLGADAVGFAGEDKEDRLGNVLGFMRVADLAERRGVNEVGVAVDERGEGVV
jgi:hypothetical protein